MKRNFRRDKNDCYTVKKLPAFSDIADIKSVVRLHQSEVDGYSLVVNRLVSLIGWLNSTYKLPGNFYSGISYTLL